MSAVSPSDLRRAWAHSHGLGAHAGSGPRAVLRRTGWVRTVGGIDAYLSMAARAPDLTADDVHAAVADGSIEVVPAARGCIYVVPTDDAPLARALAADLSARRNARDRDKAGFPDDELAKVQAAILDCLTDGPATTAELRSRLPDGTVRSLGAAGKKVGLSSTLPPAVRDLELSGRLIRRPTDDRLDHEKYHWHRADGSAIDPRPAAERTADLLRRLLGWLGPATVDSLAAFTGLSKTHIRKGLAGDDLTWVDTADGPAACTAPPASPTDPTPHALPGLDTLFASHGGMATFVLPADADRPVSRWGRQKGETWGTVAHALSRPILVDGVVCGAWEADPDQRTIEVVPFSSGLPDLTDVVARLQSLVWDQLGHPHAYSIDTADRVRSRLEVLRRNAP